MTLPGKSPEKVTRRGFLIAITGSAIAAAAGCRPSGSISPTAYSPGSGPQPTATPISPAASGATPTAAGAVTDPTWGTVTFDKILLTSANDLYVTQYDYSRTPDIDPDKWRLTVDGLVEQSVQLTYNDIKAFPVYEDMRTLECIGNPVGGDLIGNVQWKGFLFEEILNKVKVKSTAAYVKFECEDGYATSVKLDWITQPKVMLAYEMNGAPLNAKHGFPIRILTPGLYGQKMPRWITHIEFIDSDFLGYWERNGWSNIASVQTNSIIKTPTGDANVTAGAPIAIQGVAYAGKRAITNVEVQIEKGEWIPATMVHGPSPRAWTQWYITHTFAAPGAYGIGVRATDDTGFVQTDEANGYFGDSAPAGTNQIHRISVTAV